jgi:Peroxisomal biogenesis factor 11 (PEX11)
MWSNSDNLRQRKVANQSEENPSEPQRQELEFVESTSREIVPPCSNNTTINRKQGAISKIIEKFLDKYGNYISNSWNQDKILKTVLYSLWMISRFYAKSPQSKEGLSILSGEILWARYVTRLLGLPTALQGVVASNDGVDKYHGLGKAMAWSMVAYYPLEALAYIKWKAPRWIAPSYSSEHRLAERASAWSCRAWVAYIALDMVRSFQVLAEKPIRKKKHDDDDDEEDEVRTTLTPQQRTSERLQIVRNALYLAPAVHWSLPNWDTHPWLSETTCKTLMWLEAVVCMVQSISNLPSSS